MEFHTHTCDQTTHKHYPIDNNNINRNDDEERQSSKRALSELTSKCSAVHRTLDSKHQRLFTLLLGERSTGPESERDAHKKRVENERW